MSNTSRGRLIGGAFLSGVVAVTSTIAAPAAHAETLVTDVPVEYSNGQWTNATIDVDKWASWYTSPAGTVFASTDPSRHDPIGTTSGNASSGVTAASLQSLANYLKSASSGGVLAVVSEFSSNSNNSHSADFSNGLSWMRSLFSTAELKAAGRSTDSISGRNTISTSRINGYLNYYKNEDLKTIKKLLSDMESDLENKKSESGANTTQIQTSIDELKAISDSLTTDNLMDTDLAGRISTALDTAQESIDDPTYTDTSNDPYADQRTTAKSTINGLTNITNEQKKQLLADVDGAADGDAIDAVVTKAQALDTAEQNLKTAVNDNAGTTATDAYKFATADEKSAFDTALSNAQTGSADNETSNASYSASDVESLTTALTNAKNALSGATFINDLQNKVNDLGLTDDQKTAAKTAIAGAANRAGAQDAYDAASNLATKRSDASTAASNATQGDAYTFASADKKKAVDDAIAALNTARDAQDATAASVQAAIDKLNTAVSNLDGADFKSNLANQVDNLNLTEDQKTAAKSAINSATTKDDANTAYQAAQDLATARDNAATAQTNADKDSDNYKYADADKKSAYDQALTDLATAAADKDATAATVAAALQKVVDAKGALNGDDNKTRAEGLNLTNGQKETLLTNLGAGPSKPADLWDEADKLSQANTDLDTLISGIDKTSDAYKYASDNKKQALDTALENAKAARLDNAANATQTSAAITSLNTNLTQAKNGLDGVANKQAIKNAIDAMNLSQAQKEKYKQDVDNAADLAAAQRVQSDAQKLADARDKVAALNVDKAADAYAYADPSKRTAVDNALTAATTNNDDANLTAAQLEEKIATLSAAQTSLNGATVKASLDSLQNITTDQRTALESAVKTASDDNAAQTALNNASAVNIAMGKLNAELAMVDKTKQNHLYVNDTTERKGAYDTAVTDGEAKKTSTDATEIETAAEKLTQTREALQGKTDLELQQDAVRKVINDAQNLNTDQKNALLGQVNAFDTEADNESLADDRRNEIRDALNNIATNTKAVDGAMAKLKTAQAGADSVKQEDRYTLADTEKQQAYDNAVAADPGATVVADDINTLTTAINNANNALNGVQNRNEALEKIDGLNLSDDQKAAARAAVNNATSKAEIDTAVQAASDLADQRTAYTDGNYDDVTSTDAYIYALPSQKSAYDSALAAVKDILDKGTTSAADLKAALEKLNEAKDALNGEANKKSITDLGLGAQEDTFLQKLADSASDSEAQQVITDAQNAKNAKDALQQLVNDLANRKNSNAYKYADDDLRAAYDKALSDAEAELNNADANKQSLEQAKSTLEAANTALNGESVLKGSVEKLKNTEYLSEEQKNLLQAAAEANATRDELDAWQEKIETLAANQKNFNELVAEKSTVQASQAYRDADEDKQEAYDTAVAATIDTTTLAGDVQLTEKTNAITKAKEELNGAENLAKAQTEAEAAIDEMNLTDGQKAAAKAEVKAGADKDAVAAAVAKAQSLSDANDNLDAAITKAEERKNSAEYGLATADEKEAFDEALANAKAGREDNATTAAYVASDVDDLRTALENVSLSGGDYNDQLAAQVDGLNLTAGQKAAAKEAIANSRSREDADEQLEKAKELSAANTAIDKVIAAAEAKKGTVEYNLATQAEKKAFDEALGNAKAARTESAYSAGLQADDVTTLQTALEDASLSGASYNDGLAAQVDGLNLTDGQKAAAKATIADSLSREDADAALEAAKKLAEARSATVEFAEESSVRFRLADGDLQGAARTTRAAYTAALDADDATAATVAAALTAATDADKALNGQSNLDATVKVLQELGGLTTGQKNVIPELAEKSATKEELAAFAKNVTDVNRAQATLRIKVGNADTVRASAAYKNADEQKRAAYDTSLANAGKYLADDYSVLDSTIVTELNGAADDITEANEALDGVEVNYSSLQTAYDKVAEDDLFNSAAYRNATEEEKAAFQQAYANAKAILDAKTATQAEVDEALRNLLELRDGLSGREETPIAGGSSLSSYRNILIAAGVGLAVVGAIAYTQSQGSSAPVPGAVPGVAPGVAPGVDPAAAPGVEAQGGRGILAVTGANATTPLVSSILAMVMGVLLMLGFRRRED
ncbi:MAG: hypothetical protein Q3972_03365 [Corynebacterium sp.]|nr:hypothetical protein [Corynebacterium sp.]